MAKQKPSFWMRLTRIGALGAVALALLVWPAAWLVERQAVTVQYVAPFDDATVGVNRFTYQEDPTGRDDDVAAIYGSPSGEPERIVFADRGKILHPLEKPALALYLKSGDDNPVQVQTVWFLAKAVSLGAAVGALVLGLTLALARRKRARAVSARA